MYGESWDRINAVVMENKKALSYGRIGSKARWKNGQFKTACG